MDFVDSRARMVDSQLRPNAVTDSRIIQAMLDVRREAFVPAAKRPLAYLDDDLLVSTPQSGGRYLMEPMIFARLLQLADISADDLVLDVGVATGYSAAVISRLASAVVGLESDAELAEQASSSLMSEGYDNVAVFTGALEAALTDQAPYDVIVVEGAVGQVPDSLLAQLRDGGRLVAVVQAGPVGHATLFRKIDSTCEGAVSFDANIRPLPGFARPQSFEF